MSLDTHIQNKTDVATVNEPFEGITMTSPSPNEQVHCTATMNESNQIEFNTSSFEGEGACVSALVRDVNPQGLFLGRVDAVPTSSMCSDVEAQSSSEDWQTPEQPIEPNYKGHRGKRHIHQKDRSKAKKKVKACFPAKQMEALPRARVVGLRIKEKRYLKTNPETGEKTLINLMVECCHIRTKPPHQSPSVGQKRTHAIMDHELPEIAHEAVSSPDQEKSQNY